MTPRRVQWDQYEYDREAREGRYERHEGLLIELLGLVDDAGHSYTVGIVIDGKDRWYKQLALTELREIKGNE